MTIATFHHDLSGFLRMELDDAALAALPWKDLGQGSFMAKLARQGDTGLVVYRMAAQAADCAFSPHEHVGGEVYLVLRGAIEDETGVYRRGEFVYLPPGSVHTPRAKAGEGSDTVVLVLWPAGVRGR